MLALVLGLLSVPARAEVAPAAAAAPPCAAEAGTAVAAAAMAKRCGTRVESLAERTEERAVFRNADGTVTAEQFLSPKWVRRGAGWVPVDTTLRRTPDGRLAPLASTVDVTFSGGGAGPLVGVTASGGSARWSWPAVLPTPTVEGDTAVYPEVMRGVDLRMRATPNGFVQVLVVKNRAALANPALRALRYGFSGVHLSSRNTASGLEVVDRDGQVVLATGQGSMWDSRASEHPSSFREAGDRARTAPVRAAMSGSDLVITPDAGLLAAKNIDFPLYIDPVTETRDRTKFAYATQGNIVNTDAYARVGWSPTSGHQAFRSLFEFDITPYWDKNIIGASLGSVVFQSHLCVARPTWLWVTNGIPANVGNNQSLGWSGPGLVENVAEAWGNANKSSCGQPDMPMEFTSARLRDWVAWLSSPGGRSSTITLGLLGRAADGTYETNVDGWKRFLWAETRLTVTYNSLPTVGTRSTSPATSCVAGDGTTPAPNLPVLNPGTPFLRAVVNDADVENDLTGVFRVQQFVSGAWMSTLPQRDPIARAQGGTSQIQPSISTGTYRWAVSVEDPWTWGSLSGTDASAQSSWCEFRVDITPPDVSVTSVEYPRNCAPCGGIGTSTRFTLTTTHSDVDGYWWGFSDPPSTWVPTTSGAARTVDWTPTTGGPRTLYVKSHDVSGNVSGRFDYAFTVDGVDPARARWRLDDGYDEDGNPAPFIDSSGNGSSATASGGVAVAQPGRFPGHVAASLDGVDDQIATAAAVIADTSKSFSVTAWVKLSAKTDGTHTALSQTTSANGFRLEYVRSGATTDVWRFAVPVVGSTPAAQTANGVPQVGRWTHLAGVYDSGAKTVKLYVDGKLIQTTSGVTAVSANTPFRIGGTGGFAGSLADIQVWQRVLFDTEVGALVDPVGTALVGEYHFSETDSPFALDSSNYTHTLDLSGGARIPAQGAGYDGPGLLLFDGTGKAEAAGGPSLYPTQSFTVSAWVRLDGQSLPNRAYTAVSQSGDKVSAFYLGYRMDAAGTPVWSFNLPGQDAEIGGTGGVAVKSLALTTAILNNWNHLRGTYDASTGKVSLYVNGVLVGTATRTVTGFDTTGGLLVGAARWTSVGGSPATVDHWVGAIDEVRVYAGVLPPVAADWRFDSCTGTPVVCRDEAATPHPVTLSGDATWSPSGAGESSGLATNGTGSAATASPAVDTGKSFTVSAWAKLTSKPSTMCVVCFDDTRVDSFVLGYRAGVDRWMFWAHNNANDNSPETSAGGTTVPQLNRWYHLVGVYDAENGKLRLYVDGQLEAETAYFQGWAATGPVVLGREKWNGNAQNFLRGGIDDVRIQQGVVSVPEYLKDPRPPIALPPPPAEPPGRVGEWKFSEGTGTTAADTSGNGRTMTLSGAATWSASGHQGAAYSGTPGGKAQTSGPVLTTNQSFTVEAWVRIRSGAGCPRFALGQWATHHYAFSLSCADDGKWHFTMIDEDGQPNAHVVIGSTAQTGTWTRLMGVYDHAAGTMKLFVNGVAQGSVSHTSTWTAGGPLTVGADQWWGESYESWDGEIDDIRVWQRALSDSEAAY